MPSLMFALPLRRLVVTGICLAAPVCPALAGNYQTNGVEYAIAGNFLGDQVRPDLKINTSGGFIVWQDNRSDGDGLGLSARRLDATLSGVLSTFRVNEIGGQD